ncbi:MAG TPA: transcription antitermination factor NusB [Aequorivita sp.]|jgi:N utilization substance protein B|nr:transcription antitermination factor NusB [Aequorivita sp.]MBP41658.1 transcription antitermination factor NusB [Aequorivita sp.]HBC03020.1 transcription antitermination factor NusB [Aequorivita sp.]HNP67482.1 transcription antitermination factor NusB [Aequorivita sp.]|tara:strand:+ start:12112 stop:13056 length:945 start_codon:yes stop_codon:yes gene_type:complete
MLTRRHIRVKVLQSVYAFNQRVNPDIDSQEKFLLYSIDQMQDLYLLLLQLLVSLQGQADSFLNRSQKKHLATTLEKNPSRTFVDNKLLKVIAENATFSNIIEKKKLNYWKLDSEYVSIIFKELRQLEWYEDYLSKKETTYKEDQDFIIKVFKELVAPNDKLYDYLEDKRLTWVDDFPIVNTAIVKMLNKLSEKNASSLLVPNLYKNEEDREYALQLFRKVILNEDKLNAQIVGKTPNWDQERIADVDLIILKMGIAEFLYFPSIPVRATINEYLEVSKEYSTPKSSIFVNGILDKIVKEFEENGKLNKIGRGLQ